MAIIGTPTPGNDTIFGDAANNLIDALAGNDFVNGNGGNDSLIGGLNNDTLLGAVGDDTLIGGEGNDLLGGDIFGGTGNDSLSGGAGDDILSGGLGRDTLIGGTGNDTYAIGSLNTIIVEQANEGNDDKVNSGISYTLGANLERLTLTGTANINGTGNALNNIILGNSANNVLNGLAGDDSINGLGGNDTLTGELGNDTLAGGLGIDRVVESGDVNFTLTDTRLTGKGTDILNSIENATLTTLGGNNLIDASDFSGSIYSFAGQGNDTILGGAGFDLLSGQGGDDSLDGGGGFDQVVESGDVNFSLTNNRLTGQGTDSLKSIEKAVLTGGSGSNIINASSFTGSVNLFGGGGNDILAGGTGSDLLDGGEGDDGLNDNGGGDDTLIGGAGFDVLNESGDVNFFLNNTTLTGKGTDNLSGIEFVRLEGGSSANTINARDFMQGDVRLLGLGGGDILVGGTGNDLLEGGNDNDFLTGGLGNDILDGGDGFDRVVESGDRDFFLNDNSLTDETFTFPPPKDDDRLSGIEAATLIGGASGNIIRATNFFGGDSFSGSVSIFGQGGADQIAGGAGNDFLSGGDNDFTENISGGGGKDTLDGGNGNDVLQGGSGDDVHIGGAGIDRLNGFDARLPSIEFDTLTGGTEADTFSLTSSDANGNLTISYGGLGHATITDFSISDGDKIGVVGSLSLYNLTLGNTDGDATPDTLIQVINGDLIGIVQDVNIIGSDVFTVF